MKFLRLYTYRHPQTLIYLLIIFSLDFLTVHSTRKLFLGGMFSGSHPAIDSLQPVCENALEAVNNRTNILPGYQLHLVPNDTKVNRIAYRL